MLALLMRLSLVPPTDIQHVYTILNLRSAFSLTYREYLKAGMVALYSYLY